MYISHGDKHPTAGKTKEQHQKFLEQVKRDAKKEGQEWKATHPEASEREIIEAADKYSGPFMMDDKRALFMMDYFMKGAGLQAK